MPEYAFDDDKDVWDKAELQKLNKMRAAKDTIPVVIRDELQPYGLRAHPRMTFGRATCTIFKY